MAHNLEQYRRVLLCSPSYAVGLGFLTRVGWQSEDTGHVLVQKETNMNFVVSVVAVVTDYRYFVGPNGNYSSDQFGDFSGAKYLFHVVAPEDTPFDADYEVSVRAMKSIQEQIATTKKHMHFIVEEGQDIMFRFMRNVFLKRVRYLSISGRTVDGERIAGQPH